MVQRKTNETSSKDYWESLEKLAKDVRELPSWMKKGTQTKESGVRGKRDETRGARVRESAGDKSRRAQR